MEKIVDIELSRPQDKFIRSLKPRKLFLAGAGSGKSHSAGYISADFIINFPHVRGFIGANTYSQLSKSTLDRIFKVWQETFGWTEGIEFVVDKIPPKHFVVVGPRLKSYENTISFDNGTLIFTASLDNYKVIDGTEFGWAILDETKDTKEEAVKEVITFRLRQTGLYINSDGELVGEEPEGEYKSYNPLHILTSPAKVDWINEWFELTDHYEEISARIFSKTDFYSLDKDDFSVVISSTYHNERNLPKGWIDNKIQEHKGNPHIIDMLIYGSPIAKAGGEFAHQFNRLTHVKDVKFNQKLPIHATHDINTKPYMTQLLWQMETIDNTIYVRCFKENCLSSPRNTMEDICSQLETEFLVKHPSIGLYYYGDPGGDNDNNISRQYKSYYDVITKNLKRYLNNNSDRVLNAYPPVLKSKDFLNNLLAGAYNIIIEIDPSCKNLIHDLEFAKEDSNGKMLKPKVKDPITKETYEKHGHCLDAMRYFLCWVFSGYLDS